MADRAQEILDGCRHLSTWTFTKGRQSFQEGKPPCRPCADRAVEAAREEERAWIVRVVECANGCTETEEGLLPMKYGRWIDREELLESIRARRGK